MRTHYIKKAFIAIALFFFSTNILAQEVKLIKITEKNHITDIKSLYIKEPFLNEIINVNINELPIGISEKNIIYYDGKKYYLDEKEKYNRLLRIREKMDRLKN